MKIIKQEKGRGDARDSLRFFKEHYQELGEIKYIVLYYAEREWALDRNNPDLYHQFAIMIGEKAQIWMSGLTWGYYGEGPYRLYEVMQVLDPSITYEQIALLEWGSERNPIVFRNINGSLLIGPYNNSLVSLLNLGNSKIRWDRH